MLGEGDVPGVVRLLSYNTKEIECELCMKVNEIKIFEFYIMTSYEPQIHYCEDLVCKECGAEL